ncbi:hypothetical protein [Caballeronia cordobensis]|nr:hypothetical protein [Caballeronia cordobensis]
MRTINAGLTWVSQHRLYLRFDIGVSFRFPQEAANADHCRVYLDGLSV